MNWQIRNYAQKRHICHEINKNAPEENLHGHFALAERLPTFATLETTYFLTAAYHLDQGSTRARTTWSCLLSRGSSSILRENNVWSSVVITNQSPLFIQENENER